MLHQKVTTNSTGLFQIALKLYLFYRIVFIVKQCKLLSPALRWKVLFKILVTSALIENKYTRGHSRESQQLATVNKMSLLQYKGLVSTKNFRLEFS